MHEPGCGEQSYRAQPGGFTGEKPDFIINCDIRCRILW